MIIPDGEMYWAHDPAHGWLVVPEHMVRESGAEISHYSYLHQDKAYLEEDCDAMAFVVAAGLDPKPIGRLASREESPRAFAQWTQSPQRRRAAAEPSEIAGADDGFTITSDADPAL